MATQVADRTRKTVGNKTGGGDGRSAHINLPTADYGTTTTISPAGPILCGVWGRTASTSR
ncbi:hypothetical protein BaRGS_00016344, partial [Batillaria attramentaria]